MFEKILWEWQKDRSDESGKAQKIQHIDGKHAYHLDDVSDSLVGTVNPADGDNYPNIRNRLGKTGVSLTGSTEAERISSVICRLKTAYRSLMLFAREVNFNWIQLQILVEFDVLKVADMFMSNENKRMMENLPPCYFFSPIKAAIESIWENSHSFKQRFHSFICYQIFWQNHRIDFISRQLISFPLAFSIHFKSMFYFYTPWKYHKKPLNLLNWFNQILSPFKDYFGDIDARYFVILYIKK